MCYFVFFSVVYVSCKEIFSNGAVASGVYRLKSGLHYCNMSSVGSCGGGGWTLAMKVDGSKVCCCKFHVYS